MRVSHVTLIYTLLASSATPSAALFVPPQHSVRPHVSTERLFSSSKPLFATPDEEESEKGKAQPPSMDNVNSKATDGVDEVVAEAEAALKEAQKALNELQSESEGNSVKEEIKVPKPPAPPVPPKAVPVAKNVEEPKVLVSEVDPEEVRAEQERLRAEQEMKAQQMREVEIARKQAADKFKDEALTSAVGGAALGALTGAAVDVYLDSQGITEIEPIIPPLLLGVSLGAATNTLGKQDNAIGGAVRTVFAGAVKGIKNAVTSAVSNAVNSAVEEVKATPSKVKTAVDKKVKETTDEIKAIPKKVSTKASETAEEISNEIKAIPEKVKDSASKTAERTKTEIETAAKKAVEEVKATPGKIADSTKKAVVKTIEDVETSIENTVKETERKITETVDEVVALPTKTVEKISESVSNVIPSGEKKGPPVVPKPPEMPPPPSLLKELEKDPSTIKPPPPPKQTEKKDIPPSSLPKIDLPKIEVPKIEVPKVNIPKANIPKAPVPKPPAPKVENAVVTPPSPKKKEQKKKVEDNFVFSEVSLKEFVSKDKVSKAAETQDEKQTVQKSTPKKDTPNIFNLGIQPKKTPTNVSDSPVEASAESDRPNIFSIRKQQDEAKKAPTQFVDEKKAAQAQAEEDKKRKAEERRLAQIEAAAEKKRQAEEKRQAQLAAIAEKKRLAEEKKAEAALKKKEIEEKKSADKKLNKAKPGATISLGFFGFGGQKDVEEEVTRANSAAPKGIPTITQWKQNGDGSITGLISGSNAFQSGEQVTTSPINIKDPAVNTVVTTVSGSKYYLGKSAGGGFFGIAGRKSASPASAPPTQSERKEDRVAAARKLAEERKAAALKAAEERKRQAEERRAAADAKRREAEEKRQASIAARNEAAAKRQAEQTIKQATRGATVSLGFFNFGGNSETEESVSTSAPKGVPVLSKWKQNPDGSVTGFVSGSRAFKNGESITTSVLKEKNPAPTSVVTTVSGSKYFLDTKQGGASIGGGFFGARSGTPPTPAPQDNLKAKMDMAAEKRKADAEARRRAAEEKRLRAVEAAEARKREAVEKKAAQEAAKRAQKSQETVATAKPRTTISLGFLNFGDSSSAAPTGAPAGIPTIVKWRQNNDGSITGLISGSNAFRNGESVTTSAIKGKVSDNTVVQTISGSKYYLSNKPVSVPKKAAPAPSPSQKAQQVKAKSIVDNAKSGATISLGFLNFGGGDKTEEVPSNSAPKIVSQAPKGVPSISKWRQNRDGSITGIISGANAYNDGESITTSPITSEATDGALVQTSSGSKYFLEAKPKAGGFFGGTRSQSPSQASSKRTDSKTSALEAQKRVAEEKRQAALAATEAKKEAARAAAEARKREAEEKKEAARAAAEARKREAEEKKEAARVAAEAKKKEAEEKRKALAEQRKALAEEKRQAAMAAVEAKKREAESKKQASSQVKQAQKAMETAKPGATISLGFLNFGKGNEAQEEALPVQQNGKKPAKKMASAPRGTPTMYNWRQNRDGSITGKISGATAYSDGESVTTSPLATDADFGTLVQTTSGSKYYLAKKNAKIPQPGGAAAPSTKAGFSFGSPAKAKSVTPASTKSAFGVGKSQAAAKPPTKKPAPRGVPILSRWRQNRDSSITGFISGSPGFDDGERITTSPIAKGTVAEGQVVQTGSGSRYYLD